MFQSYLFRAGEKRGWRQRTWAAISLLSPSCGEGDVRVRIASARRARPAPLPGHCAADRGGFLILTPALNFIRFLVASHKRLNGQQA